MLPAETNAALTESARRDAERWLTTRWQQRLYPGLYPLPRALPPRETPGGKTGGWHALALSMATPNPEPLLWRWQRGRRPRDDERFWNLTAQNDFETMADLQSWVEHVRTSYAAMQEDLAHSLATDLQAWASGPEGLKRAELYVQQVALILQEESQRLDRDMVEQTRQMATHLRVLEDQLRRAHPASGITSHDIPPERPGMPYLPRNMEPLAREVLMARFARAPHPATLIVAALVMAIAGALAVDLLPGIGAATHLPASLYALLFGPFRRLVGAGIFVILFLLASLGGLMHLASLRRWQARIFAERALLRQAQAKEIERQAMLLLIVNVQHELGRQRSQLDVLTLQVREAAKDLEDHADLLAQSYLASPALLRDVFVSQGQIWEGSQPDTLYAHVRDLLPESQLVTRFLQYTQAHGSGVPALLEQRQLSPIAQEFMSEHLRMMTGSDPFDGWQSDIAAATLERAEHSARVAMQATDSGRPLGHFEGVVADPAIPWLPRLAQERGAVALPAPSPSWCLVARAVTRSHHPLVR